MHTLLISLRQEDHQFQVTMGHTVRSCLKNKRWPGWHLSLIPENWEAEAGGSEFKASLGYRVRKNSDSEEPWKSCQKKEKKKNKNTPKISKS